MTHQSSGYYVPSAASTVDESTTLRTANSSAHQQLRDEATSLAYPSYSFLQAPTIRSIFDQDREFLVAQGCFTLPQRLILDEFIRHYFLHVHPMLPLLNEAEFWAAYDGKRPHNDTAGKVPMIVMQAILFVCASFVSSSAILALGFKNAHGAKTAFYRRAKLLFDFNCEPSPIAIAQAAILLSHSHLTPLDHTESARLGSMWLNIAIFQAREAKAHQYQSIPAVGCQGSAGQVSSRNCLKRLWWCCIIRDRVMPLTSRRRINIDHSNFDFGCSPPLERSDVAEEIHMSKVYTATTKSFLSDILVELIKLCVVLTDILTMVSALQHSSRPFVPRVDAVTNNIRECKSTLQQWQATAQRLKANLDGQVAQDAAPSAASRDSLTLFTRVLDLYY
ncbi:hypothetical protein NW759_014670 [Fusarium solani]|nr:hypothetical protein NW759_014670 [Fusarium solani]